MPATEYSPDVISKSFIKQYYELMSANPSELYRFYKEDSCFTHTDGYQIADVISGTDKIRAFVRELDIAGARFNLADGSVDAHRGEAGGVFVVVTGYVIPRGTELVRQFVQSFFLAAQADSPAAYYVRNSVFRLLEPSAITVSTGVSTAAPSPAPIAVKPVEPTPTVVQPPPAPKEEPAPEPVAPKENKRHRNKKEPQVAVPVAAPIPEPDTEIIMESVVVLIEDITGEVSSSTIVESLALQQIGQQLAELTEETIADKDSGPKSFADLFKTPQASAAAAVAAPAPKKGKNVSGNRPAAPKAEASPAVAPASKPITGVSLFIKQLPADITEAELMNIFVGASKVDIHPAKGYGFVEFPEPVFAASTMTRYQEDPNVFSHKGMRLRVEERSLQPKGPKPGVGQNRPVRDKTADKAEGPAAGSKSSAKNGNNSGPRKSAPAPKGEKLSSEWNVQGSGNKK